MRHPLNAPAAVKPAKRTVSAESKARIAAAQKKRWVTQKQAQEPATRKNAVKPKAAGRKAMSAKNTAAPEIDQTVEADV